MEPTYYCPMCGAWFQVGGERCQSCGAPLPAMAPDLPAMEKAAEGRAQGATLARAALVRGARIQFGDPRMLIVPIASALLLSGLVRVAIMHQLAPAGGPPVAPGAGFAAPPGGVMGQSLLGTLLWHIVSLFFPLALLEQVAGATGLFGLAVPPVGADHSASMLAAGLGVAALPARLVPYVPVVRWVYGALILVLNVLQWTLIIHVISQRRANRGKVRAGIVQGLLPLALLATVPVGGSVVQQLPRAQLLPAQLLFVMPVIEGITSVLLLTWATASLFHPSAGVSTGCLVRRGLFSLEGICFLLLALPLLWIAREAMVLLEQIGFASLGYGPAWASTLSGAVVYVIAFSLTGVVTCGWFCLLDAVSQRTDVSAMLDSADQSVPSAEARR